MRRLNVCLWTAAGAVLFVAPALAFDPEAATRAYLDTVNGAARAKSDAYFEGGYWFILWNFLADAAALLFIMATRLGAGIRSAIARFVPSLPFQTFLVGVAILLLNALLVLPLTYGRDFVREHAFNLSTQTLPAWAGETAMATGIGALATGFLLMLLYIAIRRLPRTWWIAGALVFGIFQGLLAFTFPVFIAPLFNTYTPLEAGPLREAILSMARANGVPADNVYKFDTSRQSTRVTANVSGFLGTTRVSLGDNLVHEATQAEVKAVMGHELGHYVLNHGWTILAWQTLGTLLGLWILSGIYQGIAARGAFGITGPGDPAAIPLFILIATFLGFVATPLSNTLARTIETQADYFGLNAAREPDGFAHVALRLSTYRKLEPSPLEEFVFFDHPSGYNRIHRAMLWKAEHLPPEPSTLAPESTLGQPAPAEAAKTAPAKPPADGTSLPAQVATGSPKKP